MRKWFLLYFPRTLSTQQYKWVPVEKYWESMALNDSIVPLLDLEPKSYETNNNPSICFVHTSVDNSSYHQDTRDFLGREWDRGRLLSATSLMKEEEFFTMMVWVISDWVDERHVLGICPCQPCPCCTKWAQTHWSVLLNYPIHVFQLNHLSRWRCQHLKRNDMH